jgi:adenylate cyclase
MDGVRNRSVGTDRRFQTNCGPWRQPAFGRAVDRGPVSATAAQPIGGLIPTRRRVARLLRNPIFCGLISAQLVAALVIGVRQSGWFQPLELMIYDALRVAWSTPAPNDRILLIGMTEADIERWSYPLSDDFLAGLLERIASAHPRVVGVDIYRDRAVQPSTGRLQAVLTAHPEIVWVFKLAEGRGDAHPNIPAPPPLTGTDRAVLADIAPDPGDVVRRGLLYADDGTQSYTSLGLLLALGYLAQDHIQPTAGLNDSLRLGPVTIPPLDSDSGLYVQLDARGYQMLLDYEGGAQPFPRKSIAELMDNDETSLIRDRMVIVGDTLDSVKDFFATPFNVGFRKTSRVYGMEVHAHLADQLVRLAKGHSTILTALPRFGEDIWIWVWAVGGAICGLCVRSTIPTIGVTGAGVIAIAGVAYGAFGEALLLPALPAAAAWIGTAAITNQLVHSASNRARARLRASFEHYLPPAVIAEMVRSEELPKLGGERREISVLFTDVANFTAFSETVDPESLAGIANQYFEGVCAAIFANGGLVNAFLGDGVLALFGAPQYQPDHADRAVDAAIEIDRFGQAFSDEQSARGVQFGHTRIGVHTGFAFVGNVGARQRLQYTALGDVLNTASRLENLNKIIGTRICVSGAIVKKLERHHCRPVGEFIVKGRHEATEVFEPIDPERHSAEWIERYQAAYEALRRRETQAAKRFAALHGENLDDPCVSFHHQRLVAGESGILIEMQQK